ncbi:MAG: anaerobic ribonucleoside-triphosphate reductase activating protein [Candidatus Wallbacteria bacterium GWC2_49_35]|uniref:Anaerobic ribonucleoside-triphosphate reductase activating protein n=1 Tax=Candidatus Wallbacteria bacterium GWC2_49_35 TaxID=1817813 RepID=A0A1F7WG56_9BACT|nr:MAG: anaerobic ribonucleoside-triphosphate reductase activating protein [Candidatus Wallbacteria bacterium GWC2_49_35]HBC74134.1 anaerobic ribonucleoside-triphosphate reductase activating protein [Candidatus Wallbacteria bacterium]
MDETKCLEIGIYGYQPSSFCDYPHKSASVFFTSGCNMSCSYCHNINIMNSGRLLSPEEVYSCLRHAVTNRLSDAIVVSGGEPTLQGENLKHFLRFIRQTCSKSVKLDTNGTNYGLLKEIFEEKLVDFVAMDVKGRFDGYEKFCYSSNPDHLYKTVDLILKSGVKHEFRCTVGEEFDKKDFHFINSYFPDIKLQQYRSVKVN